MASKEEGILDQDLPPSTCPLNHIIHHNFPHKYLLRFFQPIAAANYYLEVDDS